MLRFQVRSRLKRHASAFASGAMTLLALLAVDSACAWYPSADPYKGFANPVVANLHVHRWELSGGGNFVPFNGTTEYLDLGNDPLLNVSAQAFTVEAWVQFNSLTAADPNCSGPSCGDMSIVDKMLSYPVANADGWRLFKHSDNHFRFCLGNETDGCMAGSQATVQSNTLAKTGVWYHVVGRKTPGTLSIFVNGIAEATILLGPYTDSGQANVLIGANEAEGAFFHGTIDTVGLFPRALAASKIKGLYERSRRGHQNSRAQ